MSILGSTQIWTYTLASGTITFNSEDNIQAISFKVKSGTADVIGNFTIKGLPSNTLTFSEGEGFTHSSTTFGRPIDGLTITTTGQCDIIGVV
jgi:hypothetical protein